MSSTTELAPLHLDEIPRSMEQVSYGSIIDANDMSIYTGASFDQDLNSQTAVLRAMELAEMGLNAVAKQDDLVTATGLFEAAHESAAGLSTFGRMDVGKYIIGGLACAKLETQAEEPLAVGRKIGLVAIRGQLVKVGPAYDEAFSEGYAAGVSAIDIRVLAAAAEVGTPCGDTGMAGKFLRLARVDTNRLSRQLGPQSPAVVKTREHIVSVETLRKARLSQQYPTSAQKLSCAADALQIVNQIHSFEVA